MRVTSVRRDGPSTITEIDLDRLASGYEHRPTQGFSLDHAVALVEHLDRGARALDVGGGKGDHAAAWADRGVFAVVLDPGEQMVAAAGRRRGVSAVRGMSQSMPFRDAAFDVVRFHLSIHYGDWRAAVREARRVLAAGGIIDIWTFGPRHHARSNLSLWFPRVSEIDAARFPDLGLIGRELEALGLDVAIEQHDEVVERDPDDWVAAVRAGFVSTLQLLTPAEIEAGLDRFIRIHPAGTPLVYDLRFDRIIGSA